MLIFYASVSLQWDNTRMQGYFPSFLVGPLNLHDLDDGKIKFHKKPFLRVLVPVTSFKMIFAHILHPVPSYAPKICV